MIKDSEIDEKVVFFRGTDLGNSLSVRYDYLTFSLNSNDICGS